MKDAWFRRVTDVAVPSEEIAVGIEIEFRSVRRKRTRIGAFHHIVSRAVNRNLGGFHEIGTPLAEIGDGEHVSRWRDILETEGYEDHTKNQCD